MKKSDGLLLLGSVIFIAFLSLGTFLLPDKAFSENENRYLQEAPEASVESILNGRFESQMEEYLSDQIIGREKWVEGKSLTEAFAGVRDINGVYLCSGGRLTERITQAQFDWTQYGKNLLQIDQLKEHCAQKKIPLDLLMVPTAAYVYAEDLPDHALVFDEEKAFSQAEETVGESLVDIRGVLRKEKSKDTFFKTDHHWTGYGAFLAYKAYREKLDDTVSDLTYEDAEPQVLTGDFRGTLYSKVLLNTSGVDVIETPALGKTASYKVTIADKTYDSLYFDSWLEKKDKYAVYFGGNYDKVDITVTGGRGEEKLLVIKDSFANSFIPYLLDDFREITMIDTRYYRDDIARLAEDYDRVLVLYGISNLSEERLNLNQALLQ